MRLPAAFRSLRAVLTFWYAGVLLGTFLVFGLAVYGYLSYEGRRAIERGLRSQASWISSRIATVARPDASAQALADLPEEVRADIARHLDRQADHYAVLVRSTDGRTFYSSGDRAVLDVTRSAPAIGRIVLATIDRGPEGTYRVASLSRETFEIHVAVQEENIRRVLRNTRRILFFTAPLLIALAASGGFIVARRALRPIDQIIAVASRRNAQHLDERLPERDVDDELGRLIRTLNDTADRITRSYERVEQFSSNVAHELRTPLTILRGEAELALQSQRSNEEWQRLTETFLEESVRLQGLVDDLMALAQADPHRVPMARTPVRVHELLDELREDAVILAEEKRLRVSLDENAEATVLGDAARLRRLFRSLLSNAVRYTDPGGSIGLRSRCSGGVVAVSIEDSGIGIPKESLPRIFDRFYRADPARAKDGKGSGLGLSLARWIAVAHGGSIQVASVVGRGSTFTVTLPLLHDARPRSAPRAPVS